MIRNVLESIGGIQLFPIIALALFLAVFGGMTFWAIRLRKPYINHMGGLPLEDDSAMNRENER